MAQAKPGRLRGERGIALLAVMIFIFILIIAATTFFSMTSYETNQAMYREDSSEAFFLADGALERARGELFGDGTWRIDTTGVAFGSGTYDLRVVDSTLANGNDAVHIRAVGHVGKANRAVEVLGSVSPGIPPMLVMEDIDINGNLCIDGWAHANGDADFGNNDTHFNSGSCDGDAGFSEGFVIRPPIAKTEPDCYPNATYYYVDILNTTPEALITLADHATPLVDSVGTSAAEILTDNLTFKKGMYTFDLNKAATTDFFAELPIDPGDVTIVVNFGESALGFLANLTFQEDDTDPLNATIINTRFIGTTLEDRINTDMWVGGVTNLKGPGTTIIPRNGVAMIVHDFEQSNAQTQIGTPTLPGILYVTGDVIGISGQFAVDGAVLVLGNWASSGGPDIWFYPNIHDLFPPCWSDIVFGQTVVLEIGEWREVAAN